MLIISMRPSAIFQIIVAATIAALTVSSCGDRETVRKMDTADVVMWTRPDSALAVLKSIDTLDLRTEKRKARYSLLYTMALDRNHLTITDLQVITPAALYYVNHGSNDDKMKMYFYLGTVKQDTGDINSAIVSYIQSKEYSSNSDDLRFKGLISSAISDVYELNGNYYESITYTKDAIDYFSQARDSFRLWNTTGALANRYLDVSDWEKADSVYSVFFSQSIRDTSIYARHMLNLAWANIFKPDADFHKSIDLFRKATIEYGESPSFNDYCVYAYALERTGDPKTGDNIIRQLEQSEIDSTSLNTWRYRILKHRKEYKEALLLLEQAVKEQNSQVLRSVGQSVALTQSDYYEDKSLLLDKDRRIQSLIKWEVMLLSLVVVLSVLWIYSVRKRRWKVQFEEMSSINDEVSRRLDEALLSKSEHIRQIESLEYANMKAKSEIVTLSEKLSASGKERMLLDLRSKYVEANKVKYQQLNDLCHLYLEGSMSSRDNKDKIYTKVKEILSILDEPNQMGLESMLDDNLDGVMRRLRSAMPDLPEKDFRFISFMILGFDAKTVARIMGYNVGTIYSKRYSLKSKISKLELEDKDLILELIS